ncbi:MAG: SUF system NifU family Fe-S cluster assembly protein [Verrucomicrobia bacterium GWF2_51_19]|nr:MAG: SUF system NifU family Fe-S cluster assembly protein [Verrucomicrobia bacterium GWF2_51_19]
MDELAELYQSILLEHNKNPHNKKKIQCVSCSAEGYNATCGDEINVDLELDNDVIKDIGFTGQGCAISQASGSLMTLFVQGKPKQEAAELANKVIGMLAGDAPIDPAQWGDLAALGGVRQFPARIKCATLAWHALLSALKQ